ncbi:Anosmin-1 [Bagarius yarrelli]|uniref:Anosmin-1 n=1 Tax=Bagarius yarrelli TaxID=175774 RepID=A0A556TRW4_BAGYA|nr:Anosmin-1 [Bagarius yarrelli]
MLVSGVFPLLLCCVVKLCVARRSGAEDGETVEKINSARCTSRCLTLHITQLTSAFRRLQSDEVLGWCENHRRCAQCLQPCNEMWETRRVHSQKFCEHWQKHDIESTRHGSVSYGTAMVGERVWVSASNHCISFSVSVSLSFCLFIPHFHKKKHHECLASAEFLQSLQMQKQGDCPSPQRASGFAAACVESCSADRECSGSKKCCFNGCGHTCQAPINLYKGVPLKPRKDMAFLEDQHGQLEVTWMSRFNVSIEPVLYILQRRWNHGIHPSEDDASPWHTVLMSYLFDYDLWCESSFLGTCFTLSQTTGVLDLARCKNPLPPERPQNISIENQTVSSDGRVSVLLHWDPPREGDLQLHHYKVTWSGPSGKESSRVVDGTLAEMEVRGLQPDTHYIVNIQAVSFWGQKRLKSGRAQLSFQTVASSGSSPVSQDLSNELPVSRSLPRVLRLDAAAPHYHNNQLQVKGTHFVITDLVFACKYKVTVTPLSEQGKKAGAVTSVTTPQCSTLKGRGKKLLSCAQDERHLQARKALQRPEKLLAEFQMVNGSLEGLFSWKVSEATPGQTPITGFQFSWVKVSSSHTNKSPDTLLSQTLNLAAEQRLVRVGQLQPACMYKVQVQTLFEGGSGPSVAKMIYTPHLNGTLL